MNLVDQKKGVFVVLPYLKTGGTERQGLAICDYLRKNGHEVNLVLFESLGEGGNRIEPDQILTLSTVFKKMNYLILVWRLMRLMRRERPDVVLSRAGFANIVVSFAGFLAGIKTTLFLSGPTNTHRPYSIGNIIQRVAFRL
ncbi:MAG: glycosyltransferase, partial [Planctomycetes bacterium]|nr:glycosyltransferase [Planctomycetota bacterium]